MFRYVATSSLMLNRAVAEVEAGTEGSFRIVAGAGIGEFSLVAGASVGAGIGEFSLVAGASVGAGIGEFSLVAGASAGAGVGEFSLVAGASTSIKSDIVVYICVCIPYVRRWAWGWERSRSA
jgi:microcompartment protein CcmK/EutM